MNARVIAGIVGLIAGGVGIITGYEIGIRRKKTKGKAKGKVKITALEEKTSKVEKKLSATKTPTKIVAKTKAAPTKH